MLANVMTGLTRPITRLRGVLDTRVRDYRIHTSRIAPRGGTGAGVSRLIPRPLTRPLPAKRRGEGTASRGSLRMRPKCHLVGGSEGTTVRAPSPRLFAGRGAVRGPGDWPPGCKHNCSRRTKAEKLCAYDSRVREDDTCLSSRPYPSAYAPSPASPSLEKQGFRGA
jgi:hypothetical protein